MDSCAGRGGLFDQAVASSLAARAVLALLAALSLAARAAREASFSQPTAISKSVTSKAAVEIELLARWITIVEG